MIKIVGVRFRKAGKIYYFDPAGMEIETGTHVIVETARGIEFGTVMIPPREMEGGCRTTVKAGDPHCNRSR